MLKIHIQITCLHIFRPNEGEIKTLNQIRFEQLLNKQRPLPRNDTIIFKNFPKLLTNITNVVVKLTDTCPDKVMVMPNQICF